MFHKLLKTVSHFRRETRGVVLILVALLMVPMLILVGVAVDVGQLLVVKNQLWAALDAAALNIARTPSLTSAQAQAQVQAFLNANFASQSTATLTSFTLTRTPSTGTPTTIDITATASIN